MDRNNTMDKRKNDHLQTLHRKLELMSPGKISRTCSTSGTRRVALVTNQAIGHE